MSAKRWRGVRAASWSVFVCLGHACLAEDTSTETKSAATEPPVQLQFKFQPGQFVNYEVSDRTRYVTQQGGNSFETLQRNDSSKHFRVVSVDDDGSALLEPIIDRIRMSAKLHDRPLVEFDSAKDAVAPPEFQPHKETVGKSMARFQFTAHGELTSVRVIAANISKAINATDSKADPKMNFLVPLPTEPITVGHRWKQKFDAPISVGQGLIQQIPMLRQYELLSVSNGIATIKFKTSILALLNDPKIQGQLIQQTPSGTIEFDIERGLIQSRKSITNETVVNALGPQTVLQVVGESTEKLVPGESSIQQTGFKQETDSAGK